MLAEGKNCAEIAEMLLLSPKSIAHYTIRIKQKLRTRSLAGLIRLAITPGVAKKNGLSPPAGMVTE
jgi:DNA-binding CsgD family transcriptional regulator